MSKLPLQFGWLVTLAKQIFDPIITLPKRQQYLAYGLAVGAVLVIVITVVFVNSKTLSQEWLVFALVALLVTLIAIMYMVKSSEAVGQKPTKTGAVVAVSEITISGSVVDGNETPVALATVWVETGERTTTNDLGVYTLKVRLGPSEWKVSAQKNDLMCYITVQRSDIDNGHVPPIELIPQPKSEYEIILEDLKAARKLIIEHEKCVKNVIEPVEDNPSNLKETIRRFKELVDVKSPKFSKRYAELVFGSLYDHAKSLEDKEERGLLDKVIEEVRCFNMNAFTYDSIHIETKLQAIANCTADWDTNLGRDSTKIKETHDALSSSFADFIATNRQDNPSEKTKEIQAEWEQELKKFKEMPINSPIYIEALVQQWAGYWKYHVRYTRRHGYLDTAIRKFGDAVEQKLQEPTKPV